MPTEDELNRSAMTNAASSGLQHAAREDIKATFMTMRLCHHSVYTVSRLSNGREPAVLRIECDACHVIGTRAP